MRESGGQLRNDKATADSTGYMHMLALETMEGESLLPRLHYVQPDDGNAEGSHFGQGAPALPGRSR